MTKAREWIKSSRKKNRRINPENISISESVGEENNQGRLMPMKPKKKICDTME